MTLLFSLLAILVAVACSDSLHSDQDDPDLIIGEGYIRACLKERHVEYHKLPWSEKLATRATNILDKEMYGVIDDDWVNGLLLLKRVDKNVS